MAKKWTMTIKTTGNGNSTTINEPDKALTVAVDFGQQALMRANVTGAIEFLTQAGKPALAKALAERVQAVAKDNALWSSAGKWLGKETVKVVTG